MRPEDNKTKDRPVRACAAAKSPDDAAAILFFMIFSQGISGSGRKRIRRKNAYAEDGSFRVFPRKE